MKYYIWLLLIAAAVLTGGCSLINNSTNNTGAENSAINSQAENLTSTLEISPVAGVSDNYRIIKAGTVRLTVTTDATAQETQIFYQPVTSAERTLKLKTLIPSEQNNRVFQSEMKVPVDLNGEMWAEIRYSTGEVKETPRVLVASDSALARTDQNPSLANNSKPSQTNPEDSKKTAQNLEQEVTKTDTNESARADKYTGGAVKRASLQPGDGKVSITVNVPAFTMTLWQGNKEIKTYYVGVGRKNYPIPVGLRTADKIIINPDWIPPDSEWVRRSSSVEPYERIPADDPLNPLGKVKIPLGDAYLLHEAESPKDLGNLVSHGCVRVLRDDLFDLTELIVKALNLPVSRNEISARRKDTKREVIELGGEIPVDINYDSMVVESGILSIYPDVYDRKTNTIENLRAELTANGIDASVFSSEDLRAAIDRVTSEKKFVVALADLKSGAMLEKGKTEPLIPQQIKKNGDKS